MSSDTEWRWADPSGQQRLVRTDELLAALASGIIAPNTPVWRSGWKEWKPAYEVPELTSSALASANGLVPNIPPPPLFIVAVQHDYEDKSVPQSRPAPGTEPPPPPRYVPVRSQGASATQSSMSPSPSAARVGALAQPPTMAGIGFLPSPPRAERETTRLVKQAQRSSLPDDAGWDLAKSDSKSEVAPAVPSGGSDGAQEPPNLGMEAKTVVDLVALSPAETSPLLPPTSPSHPTVHGTPALAQPPLPPPPPLRLSSVPPTLATAGSMVLTPSYFPPTTGGSVSPSPVLGSRPPPPPLRKRETLLLYGGAPQDGSAPQPGNDEHPSINVPAPGAQAPKAVTQAPPWTEDWAELDPTIPKSTPHLAPMRPIADSIEEITGAVLIPEEIGASTAGKSEIEDLSSSHVIPDALGEESAPATDPVAVAGEAAPTYLQSTDVASGQADVEPSPAEGSAGVPPSSPSRRIVHDLSEIWSQPQKRWMLAVGGAGALVLIVGLLGFVIRLFIGSTAEAVRETPTPAPVSSEVVPPAVAPPAEPTPKASSAVAVPEPAAAGTSSTPCGIAGAAHVIAPKAQIRIGVEGFASQNHFALGFVTGDKDGLAVALEPLSLAALATAKQHTHESIRRVVPLVGPGKTVGMVADVERKGEKIVGARTVGGNGSFVLGSADGKLVWGTHAGDTPHPLWPLEGDGSAEALRAVALESGGYAVAFRQGAALYLGALNADKTLNGNLTRVAGLGPQIGSPTLGASGKTIMVAWADRASTSDPWGVRILEWKRGESPGEARAFSIPPGGLGEQAMTPGLAGLSGGRFLLAWTEGPVASHQIRAATIGASGDLLGASLTISAEGVNAGQGQVAVLPDGRGLVVYLASPSGSTAEVVATPIACPTSPM